MMCALSYLGMPKGIINSLSSREVCCFFFLFFFGFFLFCFVFLKCVVF